MLPDLPSPDVGIDPAPYLALFLAGFVVGIVGHLLRVRTIVAAGILMIVLATVLLPLVAAFGR